MKLNHIFLCLSLILTGCGATRTSLVPRDPLTQLRKNINSILADSLFASARASIRVVSLENGNVLYDHDSKALMNPGSNMKLLTSAAALSILDTNYQFKTTVYADTSPTDDMLTGNIYLKGYGDPDLKTSDLDSLANAVRRMGITNIEGDIIVDDSFFDDNYWGAGWNWDDESDPDAPYINALSVNKNCIKVTLLTDSTTIYPYLEPMTDFVTVINRAKLTTDSIRIPLKIKRLYLSNPNTIITEGELPWFSQYTQKFSLRRPEYYTGTLFKESLRHAGILVHGNVVNAVTPIGLREIAQHYQPIEKMITNMNKVSDNLSAENVLKILGITMNGIPGSAKSGIVVVKRFLFNLGIDTSKLFIVDGSGVSRYNLLSADQLVQFLTAMYKQPRLFPIFYNSLPLAGVDGTLARRMTTYPAAYNLHAKTGNLKGVSCLSGYVLTRDGEMLVFSMMMQNFMTPSTNYHQVQDRIATLLAGFSRRNTIQQGSVK
jgi:D-alanyl-D-alanine carboxypeptidase/D-alanyl-D-alanine-endopeptidase (penicillin-binding protein 4)